MAVGLSEFKAQGKSKSKVECDYDGVVGLCRNRGKETIGCLGPKL